MSRLESHFIPRVRAVRAAPTAQVQGRTLEMCKAADRAAALVTNTRIVTLLFVTLFTNIGLNSFARETCANSALLQKLLIGSMVFNQLTCRFFVRTKFAYVFLANKFRSQARNVCAIGILFCNYIYSIYERLYIFIFLSTDSTIVQCNKTQCKTQMCVQW